MKSKHFIFLICVILSLTLFSGCEKKDEGIYLRYDISAGVSNLDPQYATSQDARLIIGNIFEGLMGYDENGLLSAAAAKSYTISPSGLNYTFKLHDGLKWSDESPLTAQDFVFAFERIFSSNALSPYAQDFAAISGASLRISGSGDAPLGINAPDDHTIIFFLSEPDPFFLQKLASTAAMPCNRGFFEESRGRYCLQPSAVLSNGPFRLSTWDNAKYLRLSRNENYHDIESVRPYRVMLYPGRKNAPLSPLLSNEADGALLTSDMMAQELPPDIKVTAFENIVWAVIYNQSDNALANDNIRRGLSFAVEPEIFGDYPASTMRAALNLVPDAVPLGSQSYRSLAGELLNPRVGLISAQDYFKQGLSELEAPRIPGMQLLVADTQGMPFLAGFIQQEWQRELGVNISILPVTAQELNRRLAKGEFTLALMPISADSPTPDGLLSSFTSESMSNPARFMNEEYDALIAQARRAPDTQSSARLYAQAEQLLIDDAVVTPVFFQASGVAVRGGIKNLNISPYPGITRFKYAFSEK